MAQVCVSWLSFKLVQPNTTAIKVPVSIQYGNGDLCIGPDDPIFVGGEISLLCCYIIHHKAGIAIPQSR